MKSLRLFIILNAILIVQNASFSQPNKLYNPGEIRQQLEKLKTFGSVLYVAAHPDDENTRLLSWFANDKKLRTAYISLTRGDGGQNLIGNEQGDLLGLIRTYELMAARSIDGAEQYFSNARDFGYSKNPEETMSIWNKEKVLEEMVWVIRNFKPDIIINRFPETGEGGHGHHTASAILAREAFHAAADPKRFPQQLNYVQPWNANSLWWNTFNFGNNNTTREDQFHFDAGTYQPLLSKWMGEIASESRSQHKSQGFGVARNRGKQLEYFKPLAGDTACGNIYCNLDFTSGGMKNHKPFVMLIDSAIQAFRPENPSSALPYLLKAYDKLEALDERWKDYRKQQLEQLILSCAGLWFEANAASPFTVNGDSVTVKFNAVTTLDERIKIEKVSVAGYADSAISKTIKSNNAEVISLSFRLKGEKNTNPYWLQEEGSHGMFNVNDVLMTGKPVSNPALTASVELLIDNKKFRFTKPVNYKWTDPVKGELYRDFEVRPAVTVSFNEPLLIFNQGKEKKLRLTVKAQTDNVSGKISFTPMKIFRTLPESVSFDLKKKNENLNFEITIVAEPGSSATEKLNAIIELNGNGKEQALTLTEINHDHLPPLTLLKPSEVKIISTELKTMKGKIGFIEGSGDETVRCLKQAGFDVEVIPEVLPLNVLKKYRAVITGIRAYNTNEKMSEWQPVLMEYVKEGGTLVVQYNTSNFISSLKTDLGPYPFKLTRERVTDENSKVDFLLPEHPLLNIPNKISSADFKNWIQERGIYFAGDFQKNYQALLRMNDGDEKNGDGSLIFCNYGKGKYIYTGLSFFRQLPAGVPGAYRLFSNLMAGGKPD